MNQTLDGLFNVKRVNKKLSTLDVSIHTLIFSVVHTERKQELRNENNDFSTIQQLYDFCRETQFSFDRNLNARSMNNLYSYKRRTRRFFNEDTITTCGLM